MDTAAEKPPQPKRLNDFQYARLTRFTTWAILVTGVPAFFVGAIDFLGGRAIDARLLGALNLVAAGVWFTTAAGFRYRTIVTLSIVLAGGILALGYGIYYGWQWWRFGQMDTRLLLLAAWTVTLGSMILIVLQATWQRYEITDYQRRQFGAGRFGIPILAVLGTLGALFQFWYGAAYGPSALPPNLVVAATLTPVGEQFAFGPRAYSVDVDVSNVGQSRVQVLASWYNILTLKTLPAASDTPYQSSVANSFLQQPYVLSTQPHRAGRLMTMSEPDPYGAGELLSRGWRFEPGEATHIQFLTFIDPVGADVLHLGIGLDIARGDRLALSSEPVEFRCATDFTPVNTMAWVSSEPSAIRTVTTPRIEMVYGWETSDDGVLGLDVCYGVNDEWFSAAATDPIVEIVNDEYGVATTFAETQVSLWPAPSDQPR
jgi:hypothetical protein